MTVTARHITLDLQEEWRGPRGRGFLTDDPRVRTLVRVLVTYPEIRHVLPDRISFDSDADPHLLETVAQFLGRQQWFVKSVEIR